MTAATPTTFALPALPDAGIDMLPVSLVVFDAARFDRTLFAATGIDCPASVQRSVAKRQAEFYYGRLAARDAMARAGIAPQAIAIGDAREPVWPPGVVGSITHSAGHAAATALRSPPCTAAGIDIEHLVTEDQQAALLATAICATELDAMDATAAAMPLAMRLTIAFSAKESLFKGAYRAVGRYFDFEAARVTALDPRRRTVALVLQEDLAPAYPRGAACIVRYEWIGPGTVITAFVR